MWTRTGCHVGVFGRNIWNAASLKQTDQDTAESEETAERDRSERKPNPFMPPLRCTAVRHQDSAPVIQFFNQTLRQIRREFKAEEEERPKGRLKPSTTPLGCSTGRNQTSTPEFHLFGERLSRLEQRVKAEQQGTGKPAKCVQLPPVSGGAKPKYNGYQ